jgi:hypothetical protein
MLVLKHYDSWFHREDNHSVELTRCDGRDGNIWCVYAYIYEQHPMWKILNPAMDMMSAPQLPLHAGCTYFQFQHTCYKMGCDYNHLGDDRFLRIKDHTRLLCDLDELNTYLKEYTNAPRQDQ